MCTETIDRLNVRIMLAASVWGIALHLGSMAVLVYLPGTVSPLLAQCIFGVLVFLAILLYPLLVSFVMKRRTSLWLNPFMFGMIGSMLGTSAFSLLEALHSRRWVDAGLWALVFCGILRAVLRINAIPRLEEERENHPTLWGELNALPWLRLMFLQVPYRGDHGHSFRGTL